MDNPTGIYTAPGARLMDRSGARRLPIGDDGFESAEGGRYRAEQGVRPVIFFTLNDVKKSTWEECYQALEGKVAAEYQRHGYLEASDALGEAERAQFERVRDKRGSRDDVESSLRQLALYLRKHHGRGVVILIDEYDAPIMTGHGRG